MVCSPRALTILAGSATVALLLVAIGVQRATLARLERRFTALAEATRASERRDVGTDAPAGPADRAALAVAREIPSATRWTRAIACDPTGVVAGGAADGVVRLHDVESGALLGELRGHRRGVTALAMDGRRVASGDADGSVIIWDRKHGEPRATLAGGRGPVAAVGFGRDERVAFAAFEDGRIVAFDAATGAVDRESPPSPEPYRVFAVDPNLDAGVVAWCAVGGNLRVWDARAGDRIATFRVDAVLRVDAVAYHAPPGRAAIALRGGKVETWTPAGRTPVASLGEGTYATCLCFSPGGSLLAAGFDDGSTRIWDVPGGSLCTVAGSGGGPLAAVRFSPDGTRLFAAGRSGRILVIDVGRAPVNVAGESERER